LAAIFVYGLATTIPGAILHHYYKNRNSDEKPSKTKAAERQKEDEGTLTTPGIESYFSIFNWPFSSTKEQKDDNDNQSIFSKPKVFSQISWPTWGPGQDHTETRKENEDTSLLSRTRRLFPLGRSNEDEAKEEGVLAKSRDYVKSKWSTWRGS
jgi:hypothetical protein